MSVAPYRIHVADEVLEDLQSRLAQTRWPREPGGVEWRYGTPVRYVRELVDYWRNGYDWRAWEERINRFGQFRITVEGLAIHAIVEQGSGPAPLPLVLTHGWPGSFVEFLDLIEPLAHPERHGGGVEDAFTVIVPSLPGYGFSDAPPDPISPRRIAALWDRLVHALGYDSYVAHGSDWGAAVTSWLGTEHQGGLRAIHIAGPGPQAMWTFDEQPLDAEETDYLKAVEHRRKDDTGYQAVQGTKPLTLSYGLTDSPAGLAAWIAEKFRTWTDRAGGEDPLLSKDLLITNIMMHWLPGAGPPMWMYVYLLDGSATALPAGRRIEVPTGFCFFPADPGSTPPERWLRRGYNLQSVTLAGSGGHFPGLENQAELIADVRQFFRSVR